MYDKLDFDVVRMALNDAMDCCRPDWSVDFRTWLIDVVISGFTSAVVCFRGEWFGVVGGVPTGAGPSVDIANISVYFVFKQLIYSQENNILSFIRFVDDGLGFYAGTIDDFNTWFESLRIKSVDLWFRLHCYC